MSDWDLANNSNSNGTKVKSRDGFSHLLEENYFSDDSKNMTTYSKSTSPTNKAPVDSSKFLTHQLTPKDTLQGLALKYNVKVNEIKRVNNIWTQDSLFIKKTILIPIESADSANSDNGSNGSGSGSNSLNNSSNNIRSMEGGSGNNTLTNNSRNNSSNSFDNYFPEFEKMNKTFNSAQQKEKPVLPKSTFNRANNANTANNVGNNNDLNYNFNIRPNSTLSFSPVVNSLDHKTQTQFSLLDDEFNPL